MAKSTGKGKTLWNRTEYDRVLAAFRESPGNFSHAARAGGVNWRTAKKLWEVGWPSRQWARPIHDVLAEEQAGARAAIAAKLARERELADAEAEKARTMAVEIGAIETQILQGARRNVAAVFGLSAKLVPAMDALVGYVRGILLDANNQPRPHADLVKAGIDPDRALRIIGQHALILQRAFSVGFDVIQLRRAAEGLPTQVIGVANVDMSAEQALEELENQEEAVRLIKEAADQRKTQVH